MQIVIEIPEKEYLRLNEPTALYWDSVLYKAIADGKPLPKGHGRLIDADELLRYIDSMQSWLNENGYRVIRRIILTDYIQGILPTIIEADKEVDE